MNIQFEPNEEFSANLNEPTAFSSIIEIGLQGPPGLPKVLEDEGVIVPTRSILNFVGTNVSLSDDPANDRTNVVFTGGSGGGVLSFNSRTGIVVPLAGDYDVSQVTNAVSALGSYFDPSWIIGLSSSKLSGMIPKAILGVGPANNTTYLRGDGSWASVSASQTPWTTNIDGNTHTLGSVSALGVGTSVADPNAGGSNQGQILVVQSAPSLCGVLISGATPSDPAKLSLSTGSTYLDISVLYSAGPSYFDSSGNFVFSPFKLVAGGTVTIGKLANYHPFLTLGTDLSNTYALNVSGDVNITGTYRVNGVPIGGGGAVSSVFTRTGAVVAQAGDYTAAQVTNAVDSTQSYSNPTWLTALASSKLTGVVPVANLGTGTASSSTYLRGDGTWAAVSGGSGSQTPWTQDIQAATFRLINTGNVLIGSSTDTGQALQVTGTSLLSGLTTIGGNLLFSLDDVYNLGASAANRPHSLFVGTGTTQLGGPTILSGNVTFSPDNTYDFGASGANRPRNGYFAGTLTVTGQISGLSNVSAAATAYFLFTSRSKFNSSVDGKLTVLNNAGTGFTALLLGGTTASFPSLKVNGTALEVRLADDSALTQLNCGNLQQTGNHIFATDNTYDIGASGATRPRTLYIGTSIRFPDGTTQTTAAAGGGTQTPWAQDVSAAGFRLLNVGSVLVDVSSTTAADSPTPGVVLGGTRPTILFDQGVSARARLFQVIASPNLVSLTTNAYYDGTNWQRDDTSQQSALVQARSSATIARIDFSYAPAGANPLPITSPFIFDLANNIQTIAGARPSLTWDQGTLAKSRVTTTGAGQIGLFYNLTYDGTNWQRDDIATTSAGLGLYATGVINFRYAAAGANPASPTTPFGFDLANNVEAISGSRPTILFDQGTTARSRLFQAVAIPRIDLATNLSFDGTNFQRDDTAQIGLLFTMSPGGSNSSKAIFGYCAAGANPATMVYPFSFDLLNGRLGVTSTPGAVVPAPAYTIDAVGDINCTGVFRVGGLPISQVTTQNVVTASRAITTIYRNTYGKAMMVTANFNINSAVVMQAFSDSAASPTTIVATTSNPGAGSATCCLSFWVLNNNYYKITVSSGSPVTNQWVEWS